MKSSSLRIVRSLRHCFAVLAAVSKHIEIDPSPVKIKIMEIVSNYQGKFDELDYRP